MRRSRKYNEVYKKIDREKLYSLEEALRFIRENEIAKFDESIELTIRLAKTKKKETWQTVFTLPHQVKRPAKVAVFAEEERIQEARDAGADEAGEKELFDKIKGGWIDFDVLIATPKMMDMVKKLGPILGPKKLMPDPKTETVTNDLARVIREIKKGKQVYKSDEFGIVHVSIGKRSFSQENLMENCKEVFRNIFKEKGPHSIRNITLCSSMGPGIKVNPAVLEDTK